MSGPEDRANSLLQKFGVAEPPIPVDELAESIGALIVRNNFDGSESGFTLRDGKRIIIGINTRTSRKRQRFSIAHEIGHVILHPLNTLIVDHSVRVDWRDDVSSLGTNRQEIDANAFAAALLMPQKMIIDRIKGSASQASSRDVLISELAGVFDVSTDAMGFRLINLGILAPLQGQLSTRQAPCPHPDDPAGWQGQHARRGQRSATSSREPADRSRRRYRRSRTAPRPARAPRPRDAPSSCRRRSQTRQQG